MRRFLSACLNVILMGAVAAAVSCATARTVNNPDAKVFSYHTGSLSLQKIYLISSYIDKLGGFKNPDLKKIYTGDGESKIQGYVDLFTVTGISVSYDYPEMKYTITGKVSLGTSSPVKVSTQDSLDGQRIVRELLSTGYGFGKFAGTAAFNKLLANSVPAPAFHAVFRSGEMRQKDDSIIIDFETVYPEPEVTSAKVLSTDDLTFVFFGSPAGRNSGESYQKSFETGFSKCLQDNGLKPVLLSGQKAGYTISTVLTEPKQAGQGMLTNTGFKSFQMMATVMTKFSDGKQVVVNVSNGGMALAPEAAKINAAHACGIKAAEALLGKIIQKEFSWKGYAE